MKNVVVLDTEGRLIKVDPVNCSNIYSLMEWLVRNAYTSDLYGRKAGMLIVGGKIIFTDLGVRALSYVQTLDLAVGDAVNFARSKHVYQI